MGLIAEAIEALLMIAFAVYVVVLSALFLVMQARHRRELLTMERLATDAMKKAPS
jgi:hypothetical protein